MTPFAIAGIQMPISAVQSNVEAVLHRIDLVRRQRKVGLHGLGQVLKTAPHPGMTPEPTPTPDDARIETRKKAGGGPSS